jgi:hypothetical protein
MRNSKINNEIEKCRILKTTQPQRHQDLSGSAKYAYIHWRRRSRRNSLTKGGVQSVVQQYQTTQTQKPQIHPISQIQQKRIKYRREIFSKIL